jgi:putative membrane protein
MKRIDALLVLLYIALSVAGAVSLWLGLLKSTWPAASQAFLWIGACLTLRLFARRYGAVGVTSAVAIAVAGFLFEAVGVHTGWPFGEYIYTGQLGFRLFGVPVAMAAAWLVVSGSAHLAAGFDRPWLRALVAALLATALDLLLDPAASQLLHLWTWHVPLRGAALFHVPVENFVAWFAISLLLQSVLCALAAQPGTSVQAGAALFLFAGIVVLFGAVVLHAGLVAPLVCGAVPWVIILLAARRQTSHPIT